MAYWYVRDNGSFGIALNTASMRGNNTGTVGWSAVPEWAASTAVSAGALCRQKGAQAQFVASASGTTTLTVSSVTSGVITAGMAYLNSSPVVITGYGTGTGGTGTYTTAVAQTFTNASITAGLEDFDERVFVATVGGTTGAVQPTGFHSAAQGAKVTDGTVTWVECTGQAAVNGDMTNVPSWTQQKALDSTPSVGTTIVDGVRSHIFICTSPGTMGASEPSWNTSALGNTTTDNTVTWTYIGSSFSAWAAPGAHLSTIAGHSAAGDTIIVGDDHAENWGGSVNGTIALPGTAASPSILLSVDHTGPVPPTGVKAGASLTSNGTSGLDLSQSSAYIYGITLGQGAGSASGSGPIIGNTNTAQRLRMEACAINILQSAAAAAITIGGTSDTLEVELVNTTLQFGNVAQSLRVETNGSLVWRGGSVTGSTIPTTLLGSSSLTCYGSVVLEGVDLSALGSGKTVVGPGSTNNGQDILLLDCKLNSSVTLASTPSQQAGTVVDAVRCSSSAGDYVMRRYWFEGTLQEETTVVRTGGASDGSTPVSWNITTTANAKWVDPFESFPIATWNSVTGMTVTVTLCGVWNSASLPNNDDLWVDVEYLGSSSSPQGSFQGNSKSNTLATGSALSADSSSAWDSAASARQNSHAYSTGAVVALASNPGRIFFCTSGGTSAGSEPGGYATAVDGGSVTDGTATFRAGVRFQLQAVLSSPHPGTAGYLRAYVKAARASSTFYVDPLIALS